VGEEPKVVAPKRLWRSYTTAVFAAFALAQAVNAFLSSSMTTLPDRHRKRVKTVTEAVPASNRSADLTNRSFIQQFEGRNMSPSSYVIYIYDVIPLMTNPPTPPRTGNTYDGASYARASYDGTA
jgi:hypothetical protein